MEKKFKGYRTAIGCFICIFINLGVASTIGITIPYLVESTHSTTAALANVVSIATLAAFVASFLLPKITGKLGAKGVLYVCMILMVPYLLIAALTTTYWPMVIHAICGGVVLCWGTTATNSIMISKWFIKKRSSILGTVLGGGAFGAAVFQMIAGALCENFGVRTCYIVMLICAIVGPGLANLILLRDPDKIGQKPLGYEEEMQKSANTSTPTELPGVTFKAAQKSLSFWFCMIAILLCGPLITGFQTFATSYWRSFGMAGGMASTYVSIFSAIGCVAVIILGRVANKWGNKLFITIINIAYIIGMIFAILWPTNMTTGFVILAVLFTGISYPLTTSVPATLCTESFGPREYTKIISWFSAALYLGKAIASPMISAIVNSTGSYVFAFIMLLILSAISLILILIAITASPYQKILRANKKNA